MVCSRCGREKPAADFRPRRPAGKRPPVCWVCRYLSARTARGRMRALPRGPFSPRRSTRLPQSAEAKLTRVCRKCGAEKPFPEFRLNRRTGRRHSPCRACCRAYRRQYYAANRDKVRAVQKRYYLERENPVRRRERNARAARKNRAKQTIRRRTQRLRVLGVLTLAADCADCGGPAALVHHETYGDVAALVSLCRSCHMARHYRVWRRHGGGPVRYPWEYEEE